jgi:hypothetical protein
VKPIFRIHSFASIRKFAIDSRLGNTAALNSWLLVIGTTCPQELGIWAFIISYDQFISKHISLQYLGLPEDVGAYLVCRL